jgi:hypothetical protein
MGLRVHACWDCGFESRRGHCCLSLVYVVSYQVELSAEGRALVQRSPTLCVCVCVIRCDNNPLTPTKSRQKRPDLRKKGIYHGYSIECDAY